MKFENCAVNGRSTKSFIAEKRLETIDEKLEQGDFLFIQFGHNDQKLEDPTRGTEPFGEYLDNLRTFTEVAKKNGATPVLLTPISRRDYLANGLLNPDSLGLYPEAVRKFCEENSFVLLDTFLDTQKWLEGHTQVETKQFFLKGKSGELLNYPDGVDDDTHLNEEGAIKVAEIAANEIAKSSLDLKRYLVNN
ncbi:GDSL-type esterase/lipase family protein [Enterococcus nangangensis]|uniref:GDSL-type esterase/lipase family protein n=1 Tax=Enterococcus nangangensis TaxID=2559926 RepID=UPI001FE515B9|nr:GDSL-type esterase/lipase family protein [Enterococcus nangangensis]